MTVVVLVLVGILLVAVVVAFLLRRRFLLSGLGAVTMWLRPTGSARWSVGVGWYGGDTLLWDRGLALSVRPQRRVRPGGGHGGGPPPGRSRRPPPPAGGRGPPRP